MRLIEPLYQKCRFAGLFLAFLFLSGIVYGQGKANVKVRSLSVNLKVTDEQGVAIPNASVVIGEGAVHTQTNQNGELSFKASPDDFISVSSIGFEKSVVLASELVAHNVVKLFKAKQFMTSDDNVPLPFAVLKKRQLTGSYNVLKGNLLDKYPTTDIRNSFTVLANGLIVREIHGAPGMSAEEARGTFRFDEKINVSARGRNVIYIIDDIPTDITEMPLDPQEIETVTIVKDMVGKSMFGPAAADGIIFIKTKRGRANERIMNVNVETGVNVVDRFPEFVDGADYARLNNLARTNSGLEPLYSDKDIAEYAKNDPYDMDHPSVNWRKLLFKDNMAFRRANISSTGGNDRVRYYAYVGYNGEGDIYKIGDKADYNRLNTRSNIDVNINDFINVQFDFFGGLSFRRSPNYGYDPEFTSEGTDNPALDIVEFGTVINDVCNIPPVAFPVYANNSPDLDQPWYAVVPSYTQNPVGNLTNNGYYSETGRMGAFNVALEYDMSSILKGLKSRSYVGFNAFNLIRVGKAENYDAYIVNPGISPITGADTVTLTKSSSHSYVKQADQAKLHDYYYLRFAAYENLSYYKKFGENSLDASFTYYLSKVYRNGIEEPQRQQNGVLSALYSIEDKYNIHGVLNYAGSSSFSPEERYKLSSSIGASWVISDENFMSGVKFIDYLKLRAETGILHYESFMSPFRWRNDWNFNDTGVDFGPFTSNQWFGSAVDGTVFRTVQSRTGNPDLTWEKRREINAGIDALMLKRKVNLEINYFNHLRDGQIAQLASLPYVVGISSWRPYFNFNQTRYQGVELALQYTDNEGAFKYSFGGNAVTQKAINVKYDEVQYRNAYQFRQGKPNDAIWGQKYIGRYKSDEEAQATGQYANSPLSLYDATLNAGDLKYEDMNKDGVIDDNDQSQIGNSSPRLYYSLNLKLNYKNVELSLLGNGAALYDIVLNNKYYQNGWGDNNYSKFVLENLETGKYPKLTYFQVRNNFVTSDFWLTKGGYFKIQNAELAWNVPTAGLSWSGVRVCRLFVRGANLATFTKVKDIDPESKNSGLGTTTVNDDDRGLYPLFRTVSCGIKLTF